MTIIQFPIPPARPTEPRRALLVCRHLGQPATVTVMDTTPAGLVIDNESQTLAVAVFVNLPLLSMADAAAMLRDVADQCDARAKGLA